MNMNKMYLSIWIKPHISFCCASPPLPCSSPWSQGRSATKPFHRRCRKRRHHCRCAPLAHAPRRRTEIQTINFPHSKSPAITEPIGFAGLSVYSLNNAELFQGAVNAVVVHIRCHIICSRLGFLHNRCPSQHRSRHRAACPRRSGRRRTREFHRFLFRNAPPLPEYRFACHRSHE